MFYVSMKQDLMFSIKGGIYVHPNSTTKDGDEDENLFHTFSIFVNLQLSFNLHNVK